MAKKRKYRTYHVQFDAICDAHVVATSEQEAIELAEAAMRCGDFIIDEKRVSELKDPRAIETSRRDAQVVADREGP